MTRLLQESLTGNTYTFIVGNISPSASNMDETMNTLKFVERARHVRKFFILDRNESKANVIQWTEHVNNQQTSKRSQLLKGTLELKAQRFNSGRYSIKIN